MARALQLIILLLSISMQLAAQTNPPVPNYSGMYSFLREGEFVQITVEEGGRVIGFVSRYAGPEGNAGFLEHFFKSGKLEGNQLAFTTDTVQGIAFEFHGSVERGEGKAKSDEAYYVLKGTLVETTTGNDKDKNKDKDKKVSSTAREVSLKSFPEEVSPPQQKQ